MTSVVQHLALASREHPLAGQVTLNQVAMVLEAAGKGVKDGLTWAIKVPIAPPGLPARVLPAWVAEAARALKCGPGSFVVDSLSITTRGLQEPGLMRQEAGRQGFSPAAGTLPFVIVDEAPPKSTPQALAVLTPLRPHPHLGFQGVLADVGLGLLAKEAKLALHRDLRPQVDTPLCAGCGTCLDVCLYDAIRIQAGRAFIDHVACTGCGECMSVCFMAGIAPEEAVRVAQYQEKVAGAADDILQDYPAGGIYLNLLVGLDRFVAGPGRRMNLDLDRGHLLAGTDPVAVDQAAWDLLREACAGSLKNWHGYLQDSEVLLRAAVQRGLGSREYTVRSL